jgi:hypothetical protein
MNKDMISDNPRMVGLGNEDLVLPAGELAPGKYSLANEERFISANYSDPLTQYATGWSDGENLTALLDWIAPKVPVGRRFEYKQAINSESFLSEMDDIRAIQGAFKRVEYGGVTQLGKTDNRGLTYRLDRDEEGTGIMTEELIVSRLMQRLKRNQYRRAVAALIASAVNTNVTWSTGTPSPDEDIRTAIAAAQLTSGVFANRAITDLVGWNRRKKGMNTQFTAGTLAGYLWTLNDVAADQGLDGLMLSKAVYQVDKTTKQSILNGKFILFNGQDTPSRDDPTTVKRFVTPTGDGDFRVYRTESGPKFIDITVEYYDSIVNTSTVGAAILTIT